MKKYFWHIKIPTYIGLVLLALVLGATVLILRNNNIQRLQANFPNTPVDITVTNVSDSSFTISYITSDPATGTISYGTDNNVGQIVNDYKDIDSKLTSHEVHYFTIKDLEPETVYYFNILSNNTLFTNKGAPYNVKTGDNLTPKAQSSNIVNGKIILPSGSPPKEAIAYLKTSNSQTLSLPVKPDGTYSFDLKTLRTKDLSSYMLISDTQSISLEFAGDGMISSATVLAKDAASVPTITLSQEYNFTTDTDSMSTSSTSARPTIPQFAKITPVEKLGILIPEKNQPFSVAQPEFSGTGLPGSPVSISIQAIEEITGEVISDTNGLWRYTPSQKLEPGVYTITVNGIDKNGRTQSISESFVIYAEGSQFTDPSVAPTKIPTQALSPTIIPTTPQASPSATSAPIISPTMITPTNSPMASISPTIIPSPQPSIPAPGSNELLISIGLITFTTLVSAMLFFIFRV